MNWLNSRRMRLAIVGIMAAMVLGGGNAKADLVMDAMPAENMTGSGKGESFSNDGLRLYIAANSSDILPSGYGSRDICVVERESLDAPWSEPVNLGPNINTADHEGWPTISPDDLELYFWSGDYPMRSTRESKEDPWPPATVYDGIYPDEFSSDGLEKYTYVEWGGGYGGSDIWVTTRATIDDDWGEPVNLGPNVNNESGQYGPTISSDGLALFFGSTGKRLHMCLRDTKEDPWGPAVDVGSPVNGSWWVVFPEVSPDGSTLYCNRGGGLGFTEVTIKPVVDLNSDGIVDAEDMFIMANHWGQKYSLCDIGPMPWGDGVVDVQDLLVLAEYLSPVPVAHWKLDETEGMFAIDSAGENNAIVMGGATWQSDGGQIDGALELDGVSGYVIASPNLYPSDGPFSIFAWIKGGAPGQVIVSQQIDSDWLALDVDGKLMTELKSSDQLAGPLVSEAIITDGQWHHIGLVWDGSTRTLCTDGFKVAEDTQPGLESSENSLYIGVGKDFATGTFFSGLIDDVRIYNRALTAEEIADLAQ